MSRDDLKTAGRGLISITAAKAYFIAASYAVHLMVPRLLGSPDAFGLFSQAMAAVSILNNVLIVSTVQTVSKLVSEDEAAGPRTLRQGLVLQLAVGGTLGAALFVAAPAIARHALRVPQVEPLLQIASAVVLSYALYAALVGSLNGRRLFQRQAGLDATFTTFRTGGILGAAALGFGALGAIAGFSGAAAAILLVALLVVGWGRGGPRPWPLRRWLGFMAPLWAFHACLNGILMLDMLVLTRSVVDLSTAAGADATAAAAEAQRMAGFYRAAQVFAFVPYQLILSMTFVVFPMISRATSEGDTESARTTIRAALRFSLLVLLAVAAPLAGASDGVIRIAYPDEYLVGAPALGVLVFGLVMFALFAIGATTLSGAGRPSLSAGMAAAALVVVIVANRLLVMWAGLGEHTLRAAALGTTLGMGVALLLVGAMVHRTFGAFLPPASVVRSLIAAAAGWAGAHFVPHDTAPTALLALVVGFLAYGLALLAVREVRPRDLAAVRRVLGGRPR
ncbi:MAG: lipopolysaccharide biosynthesis protein [Myxococcota bacterium]